MKLIGFAWHSLHRRRMRYTEFGLCQRLNSLLINNYNIYIYEIKEKEKEIISYLIRMVGRFSF